MSTTKYLLAKYIADIQRFEPRNIGVMVLSPFGVEARFLGEFGDRPGEVDGRQIPVWVSSPSAYKQWVRYWRDAVSGETFKAPKSGVIVPLASPDFLNAIVESGKGNFVLTEAGEIMDFVGEEDLPFVAEQLFQQLVKPNASDDPRDLTLDEIVEELLNRFMIRQHKNFKPNYMVPCPVNGVMEELVFSDAIANGSPIKLYQRMSLPKTKPALRNTYRAVAYSFEHVIRAKQIKEEDTGVLVYATEEQLNSPDVRKALEVLESISRVVNLHDAASSEKEFAMLADVPEH